MPLPTRRIFFYLTIVCNLATCSRSTSTISTDYEEAGARPVNGCHFTYPDYVAPYVISCRNMYPDEIPQHENVTKMELVNVLQPVLNDTSIPRTIQSDRVNLRQLQWTKSHLMLVEKVPIPSLNELDLSWNIIQEVRPNAVRQLVNLKKFNLSHNNIEHLPSNLFDERNSLAILSLSHNLLKTLPHTIFDALKGLEILDLSDNHLSHLSETLFKRTTKLQNLNLAHNKISSLPTKIFFALTSLQSLSLEDNHLYAVEADTFARLHKLMVLNLGRNPLWSLPSVLLPNNNTLFILTISHTRLRKVRLTALQNLRSLQSLHFTDNVELQNLQNDTFQNLRNLRTISLENNNFTQLPTSIVDTRPEELYLDGNPWPCDCSVQWIAFWVIYGVNGGRKSSLRLTAKCNETNRDLLETLLQLQCRPKIVRVSPFSYQKLDSSVHLACRAYANPKVSVGWLTPSGFAYLHADSLRYQSSSAVADSPTLVDSDNVLLRDNGDLDIARMSRDDAGEYTCVASNKVGEAHAATRVYADPSVMERIKVGSLICGLLWVNTFIVFSAIYLVIRKYSKRTKREKRTERMQKNMDVYKSQQISRLRERCKNQMNRIKNNCSIQVDWMKENYKESISNSQDHRISYLTSQYNEQMAEIRDYYLTQMHEVREHYDQQRNLILEFSINRISTREESKSRSSTATAAVTAMETTKMENGFAQQTNAPSSSSSSSSGGGGGGDSSSEEEEIYKYNDTMKNEIQMLTSLRNLHEIFAEAMSSATTTTTTTSAAAANGRARNGVAVAATSLDGHHRAAGGIFQPDSTVVSNGRILPTTTTTEDEGDENTSMLASTRCVQ